MSTATQHLPVPRGRVRADLVYLGWQQVCPEPDPGPAPAPPESAELDQVSPDWLAAHRREQTRLARPAWLAAAACLTAAMLAGACWLAGVLNTGLAVLVSSAALLGAAACGREIYRGERALAAQVRAEQQRVSRIRAAQRSQLVARRQQHASQYREWQQRSSAFRRRPQWYPATLPASVHRVDVAGGTLPGWSALLTTIAVPRLAAGGSVTVLDLTEGGVAADLLAVAGRLGTDPLVWVLPADLPKLELGTGLGHEVLADVLALTVSAAAATATGTIDRGADNDGDPSCDAALLGRVLAALGPSATLAEIAAALRALGQIGGPGRHFSELTREQLDRLNTLAGRGAERLVIDRAWAMEAKLRMLAPLATAPASSSSSLKVAWLDRRAAAVGNAVLAAYLAIALTAVVRDSPAGQPWQQTICLLGAERLPGSVLDRLSDATDAAAAGLVLCYRSIPAHVRDRLGRGNAAVAFMRLGNAEDARLAAEQIGTEHRFVLSQLTDTIGTSVTGTASDSYTSNVGTADSVADTVSASYSRGRSRQYTPFFTGMRDANSSTACSDSRSITAGISAGTSWGLSTSKALGRSDSLARTAQRSRELLIEPHELQRLPPSAVVLCYPSPGRRVLLADANPAIMALPTATLAAAPDIATGQATSGRPSGL